MIRPTVQELRKLLRLPPEQFTRICNGVLAHAGDDPHAEVPPADMLVLCFADFIATVLPFTEVESMFLLKAIAAELGIVANALEQAWDDGPDADVPDFQVYIGDHEYVTWTDYHRFYAPRRCCDVLKMPQPAVFATSICVPAMFFRAARSIEQMRKDAQYDVTNSQTGAAATIPH